MAVFLPSLIGAVLILIIGWIIAKIFRTLAVKFLKLIRFNVITEKAKVDQFLADGGVQRSTIALAFGIGGKEWAAGVINKYFKN